MNSEKLKSDNGNFKNDSGRFFFFRVGNVLVAHGTTIASQQPWDDDVSRISGNDRAKSNDCEVTSQKLNNRCLNCMKFSVASWLSPFQVPWGSLWHFQRFYATIRGFLPVVMHPEYLGRAGGEEGKRTKSKTSRGWPVGSDFRNPPKAVSVVVSWGKFWAFRKDLLREIEYWSSP